MAVETEKNGKPIELDWCCGVNTKINIVDLTPRDQTHTIAYAVNHLVVIQDLVGGNHYPLVGHRNDVTCLAASKCKRWIASGGCGPGSSVIIWDTATKEGLQIIDTSSALECGTGAVAACFSGDSKTLMILSTESILSFWRWSDNEPCLYARINLGQNLSLVNQTHITCQAGSTTDQNTVLITMPKSTIFLTIQNHVETVNIDGELIEKETITFKNEDVIPNQDEIGTLKEGWQFGTSKFISPTQVVTYFSKGVGAILLSQLQSININNKIEEQWKHFKMIKFSERPITSLDIFHQENKEVVIAISDSSGHIRYLSPEMKILFWLKRSKLAGLCSLAFTQHKPDILGHDAEGEESTIEQGEFQAPSLSAVTESGCVFTINNGEPKLVLEGAPQGNLLLFAHPNRDLVVVAGTNEIRLMDIQNRGQFLMRAFLTEERISALTFNNTGTEISLGCESGATYQLDTFSLKELSKLTPCAQKIVEIIYSPSGLYLATADSGFAVTLWEREDSTSTAWNEMGRYRPHSDHIVQLLFINEYGVERLLSISKDRKLVEYVIEDKLKIHSQYKIEADAIPTCLIQCPSGRHEEEFLLTANNNFKLRLFNQSTKLPRRMTNTQKYDSPIRKLISRPNNLPVVAFTTDTSLGVMLLPMDGNPHREFAILANPGRITSTAAGISSILTAGPGIILSWKIDDKALDQQRIRGDFKWSGVERIKKI